MANPTDYTEARKEPAGYRHLLSLKWNGDAVDWENRVLKWGRLRLSASTPNRAIAGGIDGLTISDTDQAIWGSFKGPNGTNPHWSLFEYESNIAGPAGTFGFGSGTLDAKFGLFKMGELHFGDRVITSRVQRGRVVEFIAQEHEIQLNFFDDIDMLAKAKFVWDYTGLRATVGGDVFGTVHRIVNGSTVIVQETPDHAVHSKINNYGLEGTLRTYQESWKRLGNLGQIGTDAILPGDVLKFHGTHVSDGDAGSVLLEQQSYNVQTGSFYVVGGGTWGTITFTTPLYNVNPGDHIFKRKPLVFEGNPAEIIRAMLIGSNTSLRLPSGSVHVGHYQAATSACSPMHFWKTITDEGEGAVLREIKEISEPVEARFYFDRSGKWIWEPFRPLNRNTLDVKADFYDAVDGGTDNIIGRLGYVEESEYLYTDIRVLYDFNELENEFGLQYKGMVELSAPDTATANNMYRSMKEIKSNWMRSRDEAVIVAHRFLRNHATISPSVNFETSLYGLEEQLGNLLDITHRTGSLAHRMFVLEDIQMDLDNDVISLQMSDVTDRHFESGYGYLTSGSTFPHAVSATSSCGGCWPDTSVAGGHGTIESTMPDSGGTGVAILKDKNGQVPLIGVSGYTQWVTIGSEILRAISTCTATTKSLVREQHTTNTAAHVNGVGWQAWPMDKNGDIIAVYNGTNIVGTRNNGTVANINTGTWGTVWRMF